jgi:multidrug efflux pump subunit AcrA (membrane-fusion protein)
MNTETDLTPQPDSAPPISGTIKIAGLVLGVVAACGLGLLIFKGIQTRLRAETLLRSEARADSAPSVSIVHPKLGAPTSELILPGSVEAFIETPVYARTNGYLKRWYFDIGARVAAGQLLAEIETPEVDQQLSQARAELNTARANFELARSTADRWQFLQKTDSVSRQETDEKLGDLRAKQATLDAVAANVKRLEETQSFQKVFAPFAGVITARNTDTGALINAGSSGAGKELFHLAAIARLRVFVAAGARLSRTPGAHRQFDRARFAHPARRSGRRESGRLAAAGFLRAGAPEAARPGARRHGAGKRDAVPLRRPERRRGPRRACRAGSHLGRARLRQ